MVIRKFFFILFIFFTFSSVTKASRILDYETETFIKSIINEIKASNSIEKKINFTIISDKNINAYVDGSNRIYITSGLIENCRDYVALLSVIAHEIGHIDKNHIKQRKFNIDKIKNINNLTNFSIIAGSLISNNPEVLKGLALNSATTSDFYINFSKDQEREADYYAIETLNKLNLYSNSIIELLKTIEKKNIDKGLTAEKLKVGTHPYFDERIEIINYLNKNNDSKYNINTNIKFQYIRAKFLGYSGNHEEIKKIDKPYQTYAISILNAKDGMLKNSMLELNKLIKNNHKDIFLLETKADILFSYGYINESVKFYEIVTDKLPENFYAQIRIFENIDKNELSISESKKLFIKNLILLENFYNNKNILLTYLKLAKKLNKNEWTNFFEYWLNKHEDLESIKTSLENFKKTNDKDLLNLVELIYNDIK